MTGGKKMYIEFIENLFKRGWRQYSIVQTTFTLLMIPYSQKKIAYIAGLSVKETYYAHFRVQQFIMGD